MNHQEKTFMDMQKSCISVGKEYEPVFNSHPLIKEDLDLLIRNAAELDETIDNQAKNDTEGHVAQKKAEMSKMVKAVYKLGRSLCHYAKKTNNQVLLKIVDISESKMLSGEENEILQRIKSIIAAARDNIGQLTPYSITVASLDALDAQYAKLASLPETINTVMANRKSATRSIKDLNSEARVILDRLDDAIEGMITDDKIINAWFDARKIKGRRIIERKEEENGGETTKDNKISGK
jgi:uncharacterized protein YoxC